MTTLAVRHVTTCAGIRVTSAARTVVDIARTVPFEQAIVVGDAAMRSGLVTRDALHEVLSDLGGAHGIGEARKAVKFLSERSESVGESRSRVLFHAFGLHPQSQVRIIDGSGRFIGRVDFLFAPGVIGEFDGLSKYGALLRPGESASDAVVREKLREDALREAGWIVIRWTWADLREPERLIARILEALDRAAKLPPPRGISMVGD
ncbi:PDDEXK family nuclease [Hoyosella subflava]|uniref:DUF559 domain-containing protein n=1 Tax=Hoyosella subflava (strain DSM 45089 / JCM 17490 / NBRC 109087 / DQS3-9A1) TaxID=443218 RepID=F6EJA9_HOYSD|nr:hypothetical protein [Hoyosella subflava]AEF42526.1 hypothetical protein AS9A_4092 [Hoyosella subflava DQS3-9A1]